MICICYTTNVAYFKSRLQNANTNTQNVYVQFPFLMLQHLPINIEKKWKVILLTSFLEMFMIHFNVSFLEMLMIYFNVSFLEMFMICLNVSFLEMFMIHFNVSFLEMFMVCLNVSFLEMFMIRFNVSFREMFIVHFKMFRLLSMMIGGFLQMLICFTCISRVHHNFFFVGWLFCVCVCVRACVHVCVRACVCVSVCM